MQLIKEITTDEMIGEFLKAELHSSRFREGSLKALRMLGYTEELLGKPSYDDAIQNTKRAQVLGLCRGWPDAELFTNFPKDTKWFACNMTLEEIKDTYRLKSEPDMTDSERLLLNTAKAVAENKKVNNIDNKLIRDIAASLKANSSVPPIILVSTNLAGKKVLIEGHSRSVAYSLANLERNISAIIGLSSEMSSWEYY